MRRTQAAWGLCAAGILLAAAASAIGARTVDPFLFFRLVATLDRADRERLDRGDPIVRILPGRDGELGVFAVSPLDAPPDTLVSWTRAIAELKKGPFVPAIRRFSDPPVPQDLEGLWLENSDLDDIRKCRPGHCDLKLTDAEIQSLQRAIAVGGRAWAEAVQHQFRNILLARLEAYRAGSPDIGASLAGYPSVDLTDSETFYYWSKEHYGTAKPVIAVTHVTIARPGVHGHPAVLVLGKEVFATHYRDASLGLTAIVRDEVRDITYLVYVNRSHVDVLGGLFGGLKRMLIEGRIRSESTDLLTHVRDRLEGGDPPP